MTALWREWLTPWRSYRLDVEEFIDADDAIVVFALVQARTERDGVLVQHSPAAIWTIREGKVAAIHYYLEREEALEAVGLSGKTLTPAPEPAGYCAGDVAGERGGRPPRL